MRLFSTQSAFGGLTAVTSAIKPCLNCRAQVQAEAYEHTGTFKRLNTKWVWVYCTDMNRRNVLIGLGGLVAGGGALVGTGAFDTVEAERTVSVETAGDADAFLGLSPADRDDDTGDGAANDADFNEYVPDPGDGTIEINLDGNTEGADGLNQNARTRLENLVVVTNQGTQDVGSLEFTIDVDTDGDEGGHENAFKIVSGGTEFDATGDDDFLGEIGESPLEPGQEVSFGVEIDLLIDGGIDDIEDDAEFTLTIEANSA